MHREAAPVQPICRHCGDCSQHHLQRKELSLDDPAPLTPAAGLHTQQGGLWADASAPGYSSGQSPTGASADVPLCGSWELTICLVRNAETVHAKQNGATYWAGCALN